MTATFKTTFSSGIITLLDDTTKAILEKANYSQNRTNIKNEHKAVAESRVLLLDVATELGIIFHETEYTFTVSKYEKEGVIYKSVYSPYVGNHEGVASVFWGNVRKPLSEIPVPMSIEMTGKEGKERAVLDFELAEANLQLSIMLPKENKPDAVTLKRALRQGKLVDFLAKSFEKPKKLVELVPGDYLVTEYKSHNFNGDIKYSIYIQDQGWFNSNTKLARKLASNPEISTQKPAALEVGESTQTTATGYPIIPVELSTVADVELPVFDF